MIGIFFASVFSTVSAIDDGPFFAEITDSSSVDFLYFSFVTLTTVGFGDRTAASDVGRMLAVTEALVGQLYLVTIVALVISNVGRERTRVTNDRSERGASQTESTDAAPRISR